MTTAHRPTWQAAKGGEEQGGSRIFAPMRQFSAKDAPSHTTLKDRYSYFREEAESLETKQLHLPDQGRLQRSNFMTQYTVV